MTKKTAFYHLSSIMRIPIGISNRHIHLSPSDVEKLFWHGYELKILKDISQPGQFACQETVILEWPKGKIEKVRVVGPTRKTTQVEIMLGDNFALWTQAPIKVSGDNSWLEYIKIIGPVGEIYGAFAMVSQRHLHCTVKEAQELGIKNGDEIQIHVWGIRGVVFEHVAVRAKDDYALDFHIDIEEANAAGIKAGDRAELIK